jgi:hypothetical protein
MAGSGIKASYQLAATTATLLYPVPGGCYGIYNVSFTNTNNTAVYIRMWVGSSTALSQNASEAFEYQTTIAPYGVFERTGIAAQALANFIVYASASGVNVNIYGIETSTS